MWRIIGWLLACAFSGTTWADLAETIEKIKPSIVMLGSFNVLGSPQYVLRGTGFVIGDGNVVATNAHVVAAQVAAAEAEQKAAGNSGAPPGELVVQVRQAGEWQMRRAKILALDTTHDLALVRFEGTPVPRLTLRDSAGVREGQAIAFTGFPIGGALGFSPVTHRGIVSSITPIVLPTGNARQLSPTSIRRAKEGSFDIFQLDATAYPGNSGGPVFDPETGEVLAVINMVFVKGSKEAALSHPSGITYAIPGRYVAELLQGRH